MKNYEKSKFSILFSIVSTMFLGSLEFILESRNTFKSTCESIYMTNNFTTDYLPKGHERPKNEKNHEKKHEKSKFHIFSNIVPTWFLAV